MNDLGWIVIGAAARVTALSAVGLTAVLLLRRRGPATAALVASTTLAVLVIVSGLAASPWPRWWSPGEVATARPIAPETSPATTGDAPGTPADERTRREATRKADASHGAGVADFFLEEFRRELARPTDSPRSIGWRWPAWAAVVFLAGLTIALARLSLGIWAVETLRARTRAVTDPTLLALRDEIREAMELRRGVEVRESAEVATPATIGWRRPAILLPPGWVGWDDRERRAVLAHELAHVLRGDYPLGIAAQLSLSIHFYHPLVHALAGRLRLQQELAADAWGARLSGGRLPYLTTLANLALRQDPKPASWPARPFLPARGTFLRRIEMLRDPKAIQQPTLPRRGQVLTVTSLVAAGLMVAGLRGPAAPGRALAQEPEFKIGAIAVGGATPVTRRQDEPKFEPLDPTSVSSDIHVVIDIRPGELLKNPEIKKLADSVPTDGIEAFKMIASGQIEQILVLNSNREGGMPGQPIFVLRSSRPLDAKAFITSSFTEVTVNGIAYLKAGLGPRGYCYRMLDDRTLLIGTEADVSLPPIGADRPRGRHGWDDAWKQTAEGPIRVAFDTPWLARLLRPGPPRGGPFAAMVTTLNPLYEKATAYAMTLGLGDGLTLEALATCGTDESGARVADTLRAALTLGRNALPDIRRAAETGPPNQARALVDLVDALDIMMETAKIEQEKSVVHLHAKADPSAIATATRMLFPAVQASREAARRAQCVNSMKQIGLAMHNYHAANDHFPPAVLLGPDGKTPYSWRVALLPYLEGQAIYSQYKFDEPWDGPNNSKLIPLMPPVYRHPGDDRPGMTPYFVPTGPDTLFPDRREGMGIREVTDGTSNTIMVVEAQREIPWTKPEDIAYGPLPADGSKKPLPDLGTLHPVGFDALFADGSVRFISANVNPSVLRALFTRAGEEVISADAY
ncbi:DUF1559 domain-containing protein [Tundrisphaera lichenicola]|uniref:DUF1559 family PulG-like putative transporter n=1 Tax=Tundrisphaera lichenicola TaxID=2029860 RepID=UPI003EB9D8FE